MKVSWKAITPIFASIVISPWNLLVGGLLIQHLSMYQTLFALLIGYAILSLIFVLYGGLGYANRKQSAEILSKIFPVNFVIFIIPAILALGQIGWAAINFDLGGKSLAILFSFPSLVGIGLYAFILIGIAMLRINQIGFVKLLVVGASILLMGYIVFFKFFTIHNSSFLTYQPTNPQNLFWGISVVVASLISFATISPDFFKDVRTKEDVLLSTFLGISFPGVVVAFIGAFLFFDHQNLELPLVLGSLSFSLFPQLFNIVTNTDGAIAVYTPGLKFQYMFGWNKKIGMLISGGISMILAIFGLASHLEIWLKLLSIIFPALIGITFPALLFKHLAKQKVYARNILVSFGSSILLAVLCAGFFPPVIISLLAPLIIFSLSLSYMHMSVISL